jgi:hypothetical protein
MILARRADFASATLQLHSARRKMNAKATVVAGLNQ